LEQKRLQALTIAISGLGELRNPVDLAHGSCG
jgi:hypothetical protein